METRRSDGLLQQSRVYATRAVQREPHFPDLARLQSILFGSVENGCHQETYVDALVFSAFHRENASSTNTRNSGRSVFASTQGVKPLHLRARSAPLSRTKPAKLRPVMNDANSYDKTVQAVCRREPKAGR
jgi:hypothetical protein